MEPDLNRRIDEAMIKADRTSKEAEGLLDGLKDSKYYYFKLGYDAGLEEGRKNEFRRY